MADEYRYPGSLKSLNVLPDSGRADQLMAEAPREAANPGGGGTKKLSEQNVIDRALDQTKTARQKMIEEKVVDALHTVYDPEIPVDIYELGLIYDIDVNGEDVVRVQMTLTAPGCPVAGSLMAEVQTKVEAIDEVRSASVELVWDPPWDREMMSEAARVQLGFL
jgi:FeS assembly SUF system protein